MEVTSDSGVKGVSPGPMTLGDTRITGGIRLVPGKDRLQVQLLEIEANILLEITKHERVTELVLNKLMQIQHQLDNVWYRRLYRWLGGLFSAV